MFKNKSIIKLFIINSLCVFFFWTLMRAVGAAGLSAVYLALFMFIAFFSYLIFFGAYSVKKTKSLLKALLLHISAFAVTLVPCIIRPIYSTVTSEYNIPYATEYLEDFLSIFIISTIPFLISAVITRTVIYFKKKAQKESSPQ